MDLTRTADKLEKAKYTVIQSMIPDLDAFYAIKNGEVQFVTTRNGALNFNVFAWDALKNEIDDIVKMVRGNYGING